MFRVGRLVILGGPSCSGKTSLIERMKNQGCPDFCAELGLDSPASWTYLEAKHLHRISNTFVERLVVHYDLTSVYSRQNGFEYARDLLNGAADTTVVTLCTPPEILIQRTSNRLRSHLMPKAAQRPRRVRPTRVLRLLCRRRALRKGYSTFLYQRWAELLKESPEVEHFVLDSSRPALTLARAETNAGFQGSFGGPLGFIGHMPHQAIA